MSKPEEYHHFKGEIIEKCVSKAEKYIFENGVCLFLFDVQGSKNFPNRQKLQTQLLDLISQLNSEFGDYFPENNLATYVRKERGFIGLLGDGSWVGINSVVVIPKIVGYIQKNYPNIRFYYDVAKDGFDKSTKLIK